MTISKDLFLSILAMDAYNCGYAAGIADGGENDLDGLGRLGSQIRIATVVADSNSSEAQASGFYAVAYQLDANAPGDLGGKTVISYRGTDNMSFMADPAAGASDIVEGWFAGHCRAGFSPPFLAPGVRGRRAEARPTAG